MNQTPHIYLAAGWFNPEQKKQMDEIYATLRELTLEGRIKMFSPFYDGIVLKGKSDPDWRKKMKEVWELDIKMVRESQVIVACTQDHDVGTIFECGYASAFNIPIVCYNSQPELGLNVMLAQEARAFVKSPQQLREAIQSYLDSEDKLKQVNWRFNLWEGEPV